MSKSTITPFSASISTPPSTPGPAPNSPAAGTPYVSPFAALVVKEVDSDQYNAADVSIPATDNPLTGRKGVNESQRSEDKNQVPESEIRPFSEGMEGFDDSRPNPEEAHKYTPEEKEKLAQVKGQVPPWWPKDPEKASYFHGATQAIKKTGCSAYDVHLAVEHDYTAKPLTAKEKEILKTGWPEVEPYYLQRAKYPEASRKEPYPEPYKGYPYPKPARGARYPEPDQESGRLGMGRNRRVGAFSETVNKGMERFEAEKEWAGIGPEQEPKGGWKTPATWKAWIADYEKTCEDRAKRIVRGLAKYHKIKLSLTDLAQLTKHFMPLAAGSHDRETAQDVKEQETMWKKYVKDPGAFGETSSGQTKRFSEGMEKEAFERVRAEEEEKLITLKTPLKIIADLAKELKKPASEVREKLFRCTQGKIGVFTPTQRRIVQKYFPKHFGMIGQRFGYRGKFGEEKEKFVEAKLYSLKHILPSKIRALAKKIGMSAATLNQALKHATKGDIDALTSGQQKIVQKTWPELFGKPGKRFEYRGIFSESPGFEPFSESINKDLETDVFAALSPGEKLAIDLARDLELGNPAYERAKKATGLKLGDSTRVREIGYKIQKMKKLSKADQKVLQAGWPKLFGSSGTKFVYPTKYFGRGTQTAIAKDVVRLLASKAGQKVTAKIAAKLALRFVPYVGWGLLAVDIAESAPIQKLWKQYVKDPGSFEENLSKSDLFQEKPELFPWRDKIAERTRTTPRRVGFTLDRIKTRLGYNDARMAILLDRAERRPELLTTRELPVLLEILPEKAIEGLQEYGKLKNAATRLDMPVRMVRSLLSRAKRVPRQIMVKEKNVLQDVWPKDFPEPMFVAK